VEPTSVRQLKMRSWLEASTLISNAPAVCLAAMIIAAVARSFSAADAKHPDEDSPTTSPPRPRSEEVAPQCVPHQPVQSQSRAPHDQPDHLLLQSEQRLLAALGYDEADDILEADEITEDDIAAFKVKKSHRRTPSGSETPLRYKDRANSEPLCDIVTRWQNQLVPDSPGSSGCGTPEGKSPRHQTTSASKRSHKRQKHQAARPASSGGRKC